MNVKEAIELAEEQELRRKEDSRKQTEWWAKIKSPKINGECFSENKEKNSFKQLIRKCKRIDEETKEGIRFIESKGDHFTLYKENKVALYLYSDGSLHLQRWGMYMGNEYIKKFTRNNCLDKGILHDLIDIELKDLVMEQIGETKDKDLVLQQIVGWEK
ncbi:hypothetical protein HQ489_05415 [Candidatus Woesearchaeota archaeon]|nr:hypothetical protein [Candidatus Woesearchaeota archaeon]